MYDINFKKIKKQIEEIIQKYVYYCLAVDCKSFFMIGDNFKFETLNLDMSSNFLKYIFIDDEKIARRIEFINYVRNSFNKLTTDERKIIYWTYIDKENNYDDRYIANNLGFSLGYYYSKKKETLIRFSYALGIR